MGLVADLMRQQTGDVPSGGVLLGVGLDEVAIVRWSGRTDQGTHRRTHRTMALDQSALLELLGELKLTDVSDRIRPATERLYQELIDAEAAAVIGAALFERSPERVTQRNGTRSKTVTTTAGQLDLRIPKLRQGSFFPSLLERRRRVHQALFAVVMEAYVHGVSTRKVDDLVRALDAETGISKSEVSRVCADLDEDVAAFRGRPLNTTTYPYVFVDATYSQGPRLSPGRVSGDRDRDRDRRRRRRPA